MNTQTDRRVQNSYDYHAKNILREKNILVHIIKALVPEFRDMSTKDIRKYICKGQEGEDSDLITQSGIDVEFEDESGKIKTDIKFDLALPEKYKTDIRFLIMVDIEPQNDNRDYKPVQRGIYYASKMISMQKGQTFISSEYDRIQQVYSIWICFNPPAEERGTSGSIT